MEPSNNCFTSGFTSYGYFPTTATSNVVQAAGEVFSTGEKIFNANVVKYFVWLSVTVLGMAENYR